MILRYSAYAFIALIAFILTYLSCPVWALWAAVFKLTSLPWPFSWVHTHDDDIYGSRTTKEQIPTTVIGRFKRACWWIWRNPNYGFNSEVLGLPANEVTTISIKSSGKFDTGVTAYRKVMMLYNGKEYFSYRREQYLWDKRYIKMWFGWQDAPLTGSDRLMLKFMFNPFRTLTHANLK